MLQVGAVMAGTAMGDVLAVHAALAECGDEVRLSVSRETAELVARVVDARARGEQVLFTRPGAEVTPNRAAELLGVSRPQVRNMMDRGALTFRMVGSHHRIAVSSVQAFRDRERPRRAQALADLANVQNDLGLTE